MRKRSIFWAIAAIILILDCPSYGYSAQSTCDTYTDYTVGLDTTWENDTVCAGSITVGNVSGRVIFNVINTTIHMNQHFYMGGDNPSNVTINSSTIYFDVKSGVNSSIPKIGYINTSQYMILDDTSDKSSPSRLEIRDSTIRGTNYTHRFAGITVKSFGLGTVATHTAIFDNVNISYAGGNNDADSGYYALYAVTSDAPWYLSEESIFNKVKVYYCGKGLYLPSNMEITNSESKGGVMPFRGGILWDNLTIINSTEPYEPSDGAIVRNSYFTCNWTKLDVPYTASNVIVEYSRIYNSALNAGDGTWPHEGQNNTIRHCYIEKSGIGSRKNNTQYINLTINSSNYEMAINIGGHHQLVENSTIIGMGHSPGIRLYMHPSTPSYNGRQTGTIIRNTLINDTHYGVKIEYATNGTFENINITNMKMLYSKGFPDGFGVYIRNSTDLRFSNIRMAGGFYGTGGSVYATQYITLNSDNSNIRFENSSFDGNSADMIIDTQNISVTFLDINTPSQGELVNISIENNSANTGNITITFFNLDPTHKHFIKKDGIYYWNSTGWTADETYLYPNSTGYLGFTSSDWSIHTFTAEEIPWPNITLIYTNATDASGTDDTMFLAHQGDSILFNTTVDNTTPFTYEWTVNKVAQADNDGDFIFNVPESDCVYNPVSCIWEIHLLVNSTYGDEAHMEWIVSNLTAQQAPIVFESFTDGLYGSRTEQDPWGRALKEWNKTLDSTMDIATDRFIARTTGLRVHSTDTSDNVKLSIPSAVSNGTWFIRYRWWPNDAYTNDYNSWTGLDFTPVRSTNNTAYVSLFNVVDGHWWFEGGRSDISRNFFSFPYANMVGSQLSSENVTGTRWHNITIIRDDDGYLYTYLDGKGVRWSMARNMEIPDSEYYEVNLRTHSPYYLEIDDIQVYNQRYYTQDARIYYDSQEDAIIVNGHNVTLERIYEKVENESYFNYSLGTRVATSYKDLKIMPQTNIQIRDSTLRMHSTSNGELKIRYGNDVNIIIENSTVTSSNAYYYLFERFGESYSNTAFQVINSTINNTGGIASDAVNTLYFVGSNFTNLRGTNPIKLYFRRPTYKRTIENCIFSGVNGAENITLQGGKQFEEVSPVSTGLDIVDSRFENINLYPRYDWPYTYSPCRPSGIANLVNTEAPSIMYDGTMVRYKYYLDALVKNTTGESVSGAIVIPVNNQDSNYPSENLMHAQSYVLTGDQLDYGCCYENDSYMYFWDSTENKGQLTNSIPIWVRANINRMSITGEDGHTPLPSDTQNTIVLTESLDHNTNYTYNITAIELAYSGTRIATVNNTVYSAPTVNIIYANGTVVYENGAISKIGYAADVDPNSSWIRTEPDNHQNTVEITVSETEDYFINISARPASGNMTLVVNAWNYSAESGNVVINFTSGAVSGVSADFTVCDLEAMTYHTIKRDGIYHATRLANSSGCLNFTNSVWSEHEFTIRETQNPVITTESPLNITYGSKWVWVNVTLDENASACLVSLNGNANESMSKLTDRMLYLNQSVADEGPNTIDIYCNNTVGFMRHESLYFSVDSVSGCYPPNTGTWVINKTLYCTGNEAHYYPDFYVGSNGSAVFNRSGRLWLGTLETDSGSNLSVVDSQEEIEFRGNMTIDGSFMADGSDILLNGYMFISENTTLNDLTLRMNSSATISDTGYFNIETFLGSYLEMDNVKVTRGESAVYWGRIKSYGILLMNNSRVEYTSGGNAGGVYINDPTSQTKVYNTVFYDDSGNVMIKVNGGSIEFHNITSGQGVSYAISSTGSPSYVYDSRMLATVSVGYSGSAYMINTSMGNTWHGTGGGEIYRQWYADIYVKDSGNNPLSSANVTATNYSGVLETYGTTDSLGFIRLILTEYSQTVGGGLNAAKRYDTPHTINVVRIGYDASSTTVNLTDTHSAEMSVIMSVTGSDDTSSSSGGGSSSSSGGSAGIIPVASNNTDETEEGNPITGNVIDINTTTDENKTAETNHTHENPDSMINETATDLSEDERDKSNYLGYIAIAAIVILAIGLVIVKIRKSKPFEAHDIVTERNTVTETETQKQKIGEIEAYISQIRPIVLEMVDEKKIDEDFKNRILEMETLTNEINAELKENKIVDEWRIDNIVNLLVSFRTDFENHPERGR